LLVLAFLAGLSWDGGCAGVPGLETAVDPVCGRRVIQVDAPAVREYQGEKFYFDSAACAYSFDARPEEYRRRAHTDPNDVSSQEDALPGARSTETRDRD
jgi:YHS domain-containing protein